MNTERKSQLSILDYFSRIIHQQYPDIPVAVRIEQEGLLVRMIIETPEGHYKSVERTLEAYELVVADKILPEELLHNQIHVMELQNKLKMVKMGLHFTNNLLQLAGRHNE